MLIIMGAMTIDEMKKQINEFAAEREWDQFHSPKNLVMALSVEVSELMENFQWIDQQQSNEIMRSDKAENIREEMADILAYLLRLSEKLEIDLPQAFSSKMEKNAKKYPAEICRGSIKKYNELKS